MGFLWKDFDDDDFEVADSKRERKVKQFSVDGDFIAEFESITQASTQTGIPLPKIIYALQNDKDTCWTYADGQKGVRSDALRVNMFTEDGEQLLRVYSSVDEASKDTGTAAHNIRASIQTRRPTNGFMWCFSDRELVIAPLIPEEDRRLGRPVIQMTLDGEFVAEYKNMEEAFRQTGIKACNICAAIAQSRPTQGFTWKYVAPRANKVKTPERHTGKPVEQLTLEGRIVNQYRSAAEAGRQTGSAGPTITGAINRRRPYKGFYWKYKGDDFAPEPNNKVRAVHQMNLQKQIIATFDSMGDAHRATGVKPNAIFASIQYNKPRSDFYWAYARSEHVTVTLTVVGDDAVAVMFEI
jgi:hypothetical protein